MQHRLAALVALLASVVLAAVVPSTAAAGTPILGDAEVTPSAAEQWARAEGATPTFVRLAKLYWELAPARGVRPEIAYAQAAKETNFGRFTGVLDASFHNPCGLKVTAGGGNYDPGAHKRFRTWRAGVAAHLDHIALYAGAKGYPKRSTPDPRHFEFLHGTAKSVERLGGRWAPSPTYGRELRKLAGALVASAPEPEPAPEPPPVVVPDPVVVVPLGLLRAIGTTV